MELSTLLWVGGAVMAVGAYFAFKNKSHSSGDGSKEQQGGNSGNGTTPLPPPAQPKPVNPIKAKKAFLNHVDDFAQLLPTLSGEFNMSDWTAAIITVNDADLTGLWKKYVKLGNVAQKWMQLLASWQVKCDTCKSFTCATKDNLSAYSLPDGGQMTMAVKYKVVSPCWVHTFEDHEGMTRKRVVAKGIVVPFSE